MLNNKKTITGSTSGDNIKPFSGAASAKILNIQTKDDCKSYKITEHHEDAEIELIDENT
jgi:hypothetical protein|tara:strand:- start:126 stop:302 length:177 start_codon:yes stop_codon:yes gene_type:complete